MSAMLCSSEETSTFDLLPFLQGGLGMILPSKTPSGQLGEMLILESTTQIQWVFQKEVWKTQLIQKKTIEKSAVIHLFIIVYLLYIYIFLKQSLSLSLSLSPCGSLFKKSQSKLAHLYNMLNQKTIRQGVAEKPAKKLEAFVYTETSTCCRSC